MIDGASAYWNSKAKVMVMAKSKTERLRPVADGPVLPRQVLQRDEDALQKQ